MAGHDLNSRIFIVGAGPAGLSAAYFLTQRGYSRVVVLEANHRVGGKCCSPSVGDGVVEAGALGATGSYREVLGLARKFGVELIEPPGRVAFDARMGGFLPSNRVLRNSLSRSSITALARYLFETLRHRSLRRPGFSALATELTRPFSEWAQERGLSALRPLLDVPVTGFGYGALDTTPAAYVLKYIHAANYLTLVRIALGRVASYRIAGGYQRLWQSVAADLDVRLGSEIQSVERGSVTRLRTSGDTLECDVLIIASPLDQALAFLDASTAEEQLFSRIRYTSYYVTLCSTRGLPDASVSIHPLPGPGVTCMLARGWARPETTVAYAYGAEGEFSLEDIVSRLERDISDLGGTLVSIDRQFDWRYFPHFGPEDMSAGCFDRIEALQGEQNTYYAGSLLSFETVEDVVAYSKNLVERFF